MEQLRTGTVFDRSRVLDPVVIVGAGAIGTAVAIQLSKLNLGIIVIDDDKVEGHNLSNQCLYGPSHIGIPKVDALKASLSHLSDNGVHPVNKRLEAGNVSNKHIFLCVDNMKTREQFGRWISDRPGGLLIDGRMGAYDTSAFLVRRDNDLDRERYMETIFKDEEAQVDRTACGVIMSIGATAQIVASHMVWMFMDHIMERKTVNAVHASTNPWFLRHYSWE